MTKHRKQAVYAADITEKPQKKEINDKSGSPYKYTSKHPDENVVRFPAKQFIDQFIPLSLRSLKQVVFQVVPVLFF